MKTFGFILDIFQQKKDLVKTASVLQSGMKISLQFKTKNEADAAYVNKVFSGAYFSKYIHCRQKEKIIVVEDSTVQTIDYLLEKNLITNDLAQRVINQLRSIKLTPKSVPDSIVSINRQIGAEINNVQLEFQIKSEEEAKWICAILQLSAEHARDEKIAFPYTYRLESKTRLQVTGPLEGSSDVVNFLLGEKIINENMFNTLKGQVEDNVHRTLTA